MASPRIITLSIGSQTVSLAEFRTGAKGALTLRAFETRELLADPAADASRVSQAALAFSEMTEAMKVKNLPVYCTLPAQSVFSRLVKLPHVQPGKLDETVAFEAQQNIPYPLAEVVWDYKSLSDPKSEDPDVLIVAAKTDLLEDWTAAAQGANLQPNAFELAPIAIYNAFRYNYGEPEGCSLLIDLGSRTTNLFFVEPGKFFFRVISSGGSALTAAVAKEFSENFTAAENRKRSNGFVAQGSNYADHPDPDTAKLSKVLRNALTRLHSEVARSISFYRSQQGGAAPTKVYISGGGAAMPLMGDFLSEKLSVPVETFNPFQCVSAAPSFDNAALASIAPIFAEHVGLALRASVTVPLAFNLLPLSIAKKALRNQQTLAIGMAAICMCAPLLAWGFHLNNASDLANKLISKQKPEVERLTKIDKEMASTRTEIAALLQKAKPLEAAVRDRQYWTSLIDHIHSKLPQEKVWITSFEIPPPEIVKSAGPKNKNAPATHDKKDTRERLVLKGLYLENPKGIALVEQFGRDLQKSDLYDVAPEQEWVRNNVVNPTEWAQEFVIPLYLKMPPASSASTPATTPQ
ncbi:MAG: type IV pilus assembly protein PilM [Verrucomicrobiota bacterium]